MAKRYEKYKDSGIAWIGEIPEHWEVCRFKFITSKIGDGLHGTPLYDEEGDYYFINGNNLGSKRIELKDSTKKLNYLEFVKYEKDIAENSLLISLNGTIGSVSLYNNEPIVLSKSAGYLVLKTSQQRDFIYHVSNSVITNTFWMLSISGTTIANLSLEALRNTYVVSVPFCEQEQIAKYLDWKCGEIDRIVEVRERQIKLLGELRTSVISCAVTRGLNPNAPLKDSGIDWIGQIPEHWDYKRIKFCVSKSFAGVWGDDASGNKNDVRCYRVADFDYEKLSLNDKNPTYRNVDKNTFIQREVKYNDILIEKSGGGDITPVGRAILVNLQTKAICSNFVHCVKVHSNTHNKFLLYTLHSMYSKRINLLHFNQTTGIQNLKVAEYLSNAIYLPNFAEQQQIAEYLDKKTAEIDSTINKYKMQIDKLKEYRQALITEVVTGKIDIRGIEIPTPKSN